MLLVDIQTKMFPEFDPDFWAYEMESMGGRWWEVWDINGVMVASIEPDDFGDFIDFSLSIGYDVKINTQESWEALGWA